VNKRELSMYRLKDIVTELLGGYGEKENRSSPEGIEEHHQGPPRAPGYDSRVFYGGISRNLRILTLYRDVVTSSRKDSKSPCC